MNNVPREKLCEIIAQYGRDLCDDPRRCEGLLRDLCGEYDQEIFALVNAQKQRVAADLLTSHSGTPINVVLAQLTDRLQQKLGLKEDLARWTVESWALALGKISPAQLTRFPVRPSPVAPASPVVSPPVPPPVPTPPPVVTPGPRTGPAVSPIRKFGPWVAAALGIIAVFFIVSTFLRNDEPIKNESNQPNASRQASMPSSPQPKDRSGSSVTRPAQPAADASVEQQNRKPDESETSTYDSPRPTPRYEPPSKEPIPDLSTGAPSASIVELARISETNTLQQKLVDYQEHASLIRYGTEREVSKGGSLEGCYVFVVDYNQVWSVLRFQNGLYHDVNSGETLANLADRFAGKKVIWVRDYTPIIKR